MPKKRELEDVKSGPKPKKIKFTNDELKTTTSNLVGTEIDFPRGGGTALTPLEYKNVRAEAVKEADAELVFENSESRKKIKKGQKSRGSDAKKSSKNRKEKDGEKSKGENIRVEHLNYKRVVEGMNILCQIIAIRPLALIVSLPCQLVGHVPITQISTQFTKQLEALDESAENLSDQEDDIRRPPELFEMFRVGQYLRAVVTGVQPAGASARGVIGSNRRMDENERASQRVELSIIPDHINKGVSKADLTSGFVLPAAIQSVEDHGYILDFGISKVSGFLSFEDAKKGPYPNKLPAGLVLDVCITSVAENGRTCNVSIELKRMATNFMSEITSVTSILPGTLVQALVTAVVGSGLNVQLLGYFEGTIDLFHLPSGGISSRFKLGDKVKARILWEIGNTEPRRFALSLLPHVVDLDVPRLKDQQPHQEAFPIGITLEAVKVVRVEVERGLVMQIQDGVLGYVHIRHVSDDHVPSLSPSSGHWKVGTVHCARVIGFQALDGILQLSLQPSVLEQKFLQVQDVELGEVLKATVKKLTNDALFVSLSGSVDGVIWPNHYADISLKHPQKRFKEGSTIKCRVLVVDADRKRIALTAKKTLVESELPVITSLDDVKVGMVTHAVVYKILSNAVLVEFYNNLNALVPAKEASETPLANLSEAFAIGKPVKVRIIHVDRETGRMQASIRQGNSKVVEAANVHGVEVGETVEGSIKAIHKEHVVVTLKPTGITALLSVKNFANSRNTTDAQLRATIAVGETVDDLIVLSQNPDKGIVIVSKRPKSKPTKTVPGNDGLTFKAVKVGEAVFGRVTGIARGGTGLHIASGVKGVLYPTDTCDDYESGEPFPPNGVVVEGVVMSLDPARRLIVVSTRPSRLNPSNEIVPRDREISDVKVLKVGDSLRGFIKSIADHGLFVSIGRNIDARIQIKELFDEYIKDWKPRFVVNQLVQGKILKVDPEKNQVEMTLRSKPVELALNDFQKDQKVDGIIRKSEPYGVFIQIKNTKISGLCHKSQISDNSDADVSEILSNFQEGDSVKAIILTIDHVKGRIAFGLKPSYFTDNDFEMHSPDVEETEENTAEPATVGEKNGASESDEDEEVVNMPSDMMEVEVPTPMALPTSEVAPIIKIPGGFRWSAQADTQEAAASDSSSEEDSDSNPNIQSSKKKKKTIEYDLTAHMHTRQPESTADFERLLLGSPNSSYLWVQYMSFQLQLAEIEKAKEVGRRALKTINFREEGEKMNVWIAILNLENKYGTDESLDVVFKDAARHNDSKTIHLRLASIFDETGRHDQAVEQHQKTCKKFSKSSKVWTLFGEYYFKQGEQEAARQLLPRSLLSLEKRKHLKTITKFAQMEYRHGDAERGRTIFEGIVDSHSKRWDLWSIYVDMEATQKNILAIRNIFDRVFAFKMTSHKAKAFFKKWLDIEKRLGDEEGENAVKTKAVEWTGKASAGAS
ncbi:U3 snoRNP-associated protein Rrp5 [Hysterangium stoloniferum]|nr:U3 snoRNP-associated protein Rrp5 [Hysterangium stoloniferum]